MTIIKSYATDVTRGREGGREGGMEGGREGGMEGGKKNITNEIFETVISAISNNL